MQMSRCTVHLNIHISTARKLSNGQTYTIYSSLMKPAAGDVGALPITGGAS